MTPRFLARAAGWMVRLFHKLETPNEDGRCVDSVLQMLCGESIWDVQGQVASRQVDTWAWGPC